MSKSLIRFVYIYHIAVKSLSFISSLSLSFPLFSFFGWDEKYIYPRSIPSNLIRTYYKNDIVTPLRFMKWRGVLIIQKSITINSPPDAKRWLDELDHLVIWKQYAKKRSRADGFFGGCSVD